MTIFQPFLLTSAIPYVNSEPHLGHALELVQSDAIARYQRTLGVDLHFTSGTDDNSLKNVRAALLAGTTPAELVARYGAGFRQLARALHVEHDDFIHTASDPRHVPAVHALWQRCVESGDVYKKSYSGRYCVGCEHFLRESEIVDDKCPVHPEPLELLEEENWFFRLSRYESAISWAIQSGQLQILPAERRHEVEQFIASGLSDFSISRSRARAQGWGIAVPGDETQIIYVWFDALANYLSVLGYPNDERFRRYWRDATERWHIIGKDIVRFHALYWPGILLSAGLPLPTSIRVHGFVTAHGKKIGKSLGNAVDPFRLAARYGADALRYYLLAHLHTSKDSDFREDLLSAAYTSELAGKLGNLLQRVCALVERYDVNIVNTNLDPILREVARQTEERVASAVDDFALHDAVRAIFELVAAANRYVDSSAPWQLAKSPSNAAALERCLSSLVHALRVTARLLTPFLPDTARAINARLEPRPHGGPP
ncbi:MAG TPA: methionine--tRNA ligase, partial [Polyangiaceae bacterium]|nr:methionine--tRNA ligase [Polyangiaceae bacterium]